MSVNDRLDRIEAHMPPGSCPTCVTWSHRVEMDGTPSAYELRERQRRLDREGPGPLEWPPECPDCGRPIDTIVLTHVEGQPPARGSLLSRWLRLESSE